MALVESLVQAAVTVAVAAVVVVLAALQPKVLLAGLVSQFPVKTQPEAEAGRLLSGRLGLQVSAAMAGLVLQRASPARLCHTVAVAEAGVKI